MRLTGPVAMADEEFATIKENIVLNSVITLGIVLFILWMALRSATAHSSRCSSMCSSALPSPQPSVCCWSVRSIRYRYVLRCCLSASVSISAFNTACAIVPNVMSFDDLSGRDQAGRAAVRRAA